nr:transposase, mutator type [Tanacetum cinerariifolium]
MDQPLTMNEYQARAPQQPVSYVARPIVVESVVDPFDGLDEILGDYANTRKQITGDASTWKHMVVHVVEEVHVNMNNFSFTTHPKHDTSKGVVDVQQDDIDVIDYDSFGSDLDDGIDSERRIQLRELRRICKQKNKCPNKYYFYLGQQFASMEIVKGRVKKHSVETIRQLILMKNDNERVRVRCEDTIPALVPYVAIDNNIDKNVFSQTKGSLAIRENINSGKQNILGKDQTVEGEGKKVITPKKVDKYSCPWTMLVTYTKECRWEVRTLIKDHTCIQSRAIKACTSRFLADHVIKSLATNLDIPVRAVQDQMQKKFEKRYSFNPILNLNCPHGLTQAIASVFQSAEHRYCVRHIHENMKSQFKGGVYKEMLWNAAKATSVGEFKKKIGELKSFNSDAYDWSISCGKCGNVGHNKKGCRGQGGGSSQAGARKVSGQAAGSRKVSGQATGARNVSGQAAGARKASSQPSTA